MNPSNMLADLQNPEHLKHGLCTVVAVALLSYLLPNVLPRDENEESNTMLNNIHKVFNSVQENPAPILLVVFVSCVLGAVLCKNMPANMVSPLPAAAPAAGQ